MEVRNLNIHLLAVKWHMLVDYALIGLLLVLPNLLNGHKTAKLVCGAKALVLLPDVGLANQPVAVRKLIPSAIHRKLDPSNIAQFALQRLLNLFRKGKCELALNVAVALHASAAVWFTDWKKIGQ